MANKQNQKLAEELRQFNRFYTESIGSLDDQHEGLDVSLAQARMLFTISSLGQSASGQSQLGQLQVGQLAEALRLDLAYTSRVLGSLEDARLIRRTISKEDRRQRVVTLTAKGKKLLAEIERRSSERMLGLVSHLNRKQTGQLLEALNTVVELLDKDRSDE